MSNFIYFIEKTSSRFNGNNRVAIFVGLASLIIAYIIFIAGLITDSDKSKIYKKILLKKSNIIKTMSLTVIVLLYFLLFENASLESRLPSYLLIILDVIFDLIIIWLGCYLINNFKHITYNILDENKYEKTKEKYVKNIFNNYLKNTKSIIKKNDNKNKRVNNLNFTNIKIDKDLDKVLPDFLPLKLYETGRIDDIKMISLKKIDSELNKIFISNSLDINDEELISDFDSSIINYQIIIRKLEGDYVNKDTIILYYNKELNDSILNKLRRAFIIKPDKENDIYVTEILSEYRRQYYNALDTNDDDLLFSSHKDYYNLIKILIDKRNDKAMFYLKDSLNKIYIKYSDDNKKLEDMQTLIFNINNIVLTNKKVKNIDRYLLFNLYFKILNTRLSILLEKNKYEEIELLFKQINITELNNIEFELNKTNNNVYLSLFYKELIIFINNSLKYKSNLILNDSLFSLISELYVGTSKLNKYNSLKSVVLKNERNKERLNLEIDLLKNNIETDYLYILGIYSSLIYNKENFIKNYLSNKNNIISLLNSKYNSYIDVSLVLDLYLSNNESENIILKEISSWNIYDKDNEINYLDLVYPFLALFINSTNKVDTNINYSLEYKYKVKNLLDIIDSLSESESFKIIKKLCENYDENINSLKIDLNIIYQQMCEKENKLIINEVIEESTKKEFNNIIINKLDDSTSNLLNYMRAKNFIVKETSSSAKYVGYNQICDKKLFLTKNIYLLANGYSKSITNYKEKLVVDNLESHGIEVQDVKFVLRKTLKRFKNPNDIIVLCNYVEDDFIIKGINGYYILHKNHKVKVITGVKTNYKYIVTNKESLGLIKELEFNSYDYERFNVKENKNSDTLINIMDLSSEENDIRKNIIRKDFSWLNKKFNSKDEIEDYLKTKCLIKIYQKIEYSKNDVISFLIDKY